VLSEHFEIDHPQTSRPVEVRQRKPPTLFVFDPRRYRRHRGSLLFADRVFLGSVWTPLVRVRARWPRASDGGTEI
jgi:hypothetical protein